jgi:hypothetical protein
MTSLAALALVCAAGTAPAPAVRALSVHPERVSLRGGDDTAQLVVTATLADGRLLDVTHTAAYRVSRPTLATVSGGRVVPAANGEGAVEVTYGSQRVSLPLATAHVGEDLPINFPNQVVPVFTKLGCNSGGCHGKLAGQNGFRLSLLGFEPELDYATLLKEDRGRRVFPASPDQSLLLTKAVGVKPHGGGRRMEPNSDEYKLVRRWIAAGTPYGRPSDPVVTKITIFPETRVLARQSRQQLAVHAHYSDGTVEDVTRRAQYESNDTEVATVETTGRVHTLSLSGQAAVMARYQGQVTVFRATVPLGERIPEYTFAPKTVVDEFTAKKWRELGLVPSDVCTDEQFLRRASLDLTGTLPTPDAIKAFVADKDPAKRDALVDRLIDSPEYAYYFAAKWADVLRVKRKQQPGRAFGTFAFHTWIREAMAGDKPYDEFAREVLGAVGDETKCPPAVWYKEIKTPEQFVDDAAQVFLGLRMACANCHHHPYEKWGQDDYWGLAAFFGRVGRKDVPVPGQVQQQNNRDRREVIFVKASGSVTNKRTGKPAELKPLDAPPVTADAGTDPRQLLADWLGRPDNPYFAKAVSNRYWAHFFGRGIVDPLDDMRVTNPPSNPELLDALAKELTTHKYSLKHLVRVICKSRTYQLRSTPNEFNKHDKQAYARYYPKRLSAEVLLDAVGQVTDSPTRFGGLPADAHAPQRAIMLPDESFGSYFLDVFGRPQRISACECERVSEANLAQALHLLNSDEVQGKLSRGGGRADKLAQDKRPDAEKIEELFLWAFGRKPTPADLNAALAHVNKHTADKKVAYENILWALINTKEFVFNQ